VNRVDAINLTNASPLGQQSIGGSGISLSEFDLVVITGPNGSGKSTLAAALANPKGGVTVIGGDVSTWSGSAADGTAASLLIRSGSQLMGSFVSLGDALAAASGVARIREEKSLLKLLLNPRSDAQFGLACLMPAAAHEEDAELRRRIADYRAVEQRARDVIGVDQPMTLATYNEIGAEVARRLDSSWSAVAEVDQEVMRNAEAAVSPALKVIVGETRLLREIAAALELFDTAGAPRAIDQITDAEGRLSDQIRKAMELAPLAGDEAAPATEQWPARCRRFADQVDERVKKLKQDRQSLDMLGSIRHEAERWLAQHQSDDCPVCKSAIDHDRLLAELRGGGASERIAEIARALENLDAAATSLRLVAEEIEECIASVKRAQRVVAVLLKQWADAIKALDAACVAAVGWPEESVAMAEDLRAACARALGMPHWSGISADSVANAVEAVDGLRDKISDVKVTREERHADLHRNLPAAEVAFGQLGPLRELLLAREDLNTNRWMPCWEAAITDERKRRVIARWQTAVRERIAELEAKEDEAQRAVLDNSSVRIRFRSLLEATGHPLLEKAELGAESVTSEGVKIDTKGSRTRAGVCLPALSEGCRVIVNLAAFIAVSGHVCDGQQHQAGWLVLDEPTNALDAKNRSEVAKYLGGLSTELMPRQMFITTFDEEFRDELVAAAKASGRRVLLIELPEWTGRRPVVPTLRPLQRCRDAGLIDVDRDPAILQERRR